MHFFECCCCLKSNDGEVATRPFGVVVLLSIYCLEDFLKACQALTGIHVKGRFGPLWNSAEHVPFVFNNYDRTATITKPAFTSAHCQHPCR